MVLSQLLKIEKVYTYKCVSLDECHKIIDECLLWRNIQYIVKENSVDYNDDNKYYKYILEIRTLEEV